MKKHFLVPGVMTLFLVLSGNTQVQAQGAQVVSTQRAGDDLLILSLKFHQTMGPHQVSDTLGDAARNPWVRSIISYAAGAAGVPPALTQVAMDIASEQTAGKKSEERSYALTYPAGWSFCHASADVISVNPRHGKRASVMAASTEPQQMRFTAWTPKKGVFQGRSWMEFDYRVVLIRSEMQADAIAKNVCARPGPILNCRGSGTDRPRCGHHEL